MKALLVVCLCLFNVGALAEPVPLFTAGPPIAADDPIHRVTKHLDNFKRAHAIVLNPAAFGANAVTVDINGNVHTFVMRPSDHHVTGMTLWEGEENDDSFDKRPDILLRHSDKGGLSGNFFLPPRSYFAFQSESPTRLTEMESDVGVRPGPYWLQMVATCRDPPRRRIRIRRRHGLHLAPGGVSTEHCQSSCTRRRNHLRGHLVALRSCRVLHGSWGRLEPRASRHARGIRNPLLCRCEHWRCLLASARCLCSRRFYLAVR